jgi:hypothetical protein
MAFTPEVFRRRARRAYELGRLRLSLPWAVLTGSVGLLGTLVTGGVVFGVTMSLVACAAAITCVWYGRHVGRGVWPGIWVGSVAMLLALVAWVCVGRGGNSFFECRLPCVLAGLIVTGGAVYHRRRGAAPREALLTLVGTVAIATPLALIACHGVGVGGVVGLVAGLALGSAPVFLRALRANV